MAKIFGIIALLLIIVGGIFAGIKIGERKNTPTSTSTTSASSTPVNLNDGKVLDLSNKGLTKVDASIYSQTATTTLILSYNSISSLPSQMDKMTNLKVLKVDHNRLEGALIGEIRKMPLRILDASYNNMTGIPAEIGQLNLLEELNYSYNKIDTLPNEIFKLTQLKRLDLTGNPMPADKVQELRQKLPNTTIVI